MNQSFTCLCRLPSDAYDVNVTPDKRKVMLHKESQAMTFLQQSLLALWEPSRFTYDLNKAAGGTATQRTQQQQQQQHRSLEDGGSGSKKLDTFAMGGPGSNAGLSASPGSIELTPTVGKDPGSGAGGRSTRTTAAAAAAETDANIRQGNEVQGGLEDGDEAHEDVHEEEADVDVDAPAAKRRAVMPLTAFMMGGKDKPISTAAAPGNGNDSDNNRRGGRRRREQQDNEQQPSLFQYGFRKEEGEQVNGRSKGRGSARDESSEEEEEEEESDDDDMEEDTDSGVGVDVDVDEKKENERLKQTEQQQHAAEERQEDREKVPLQLKKQGPGDEEEEEEDDGIDLTGTPINTEQQQEVSPGQGPDSAAGASLPVAGSELIVEVNLQGIRHRLVAAAARQQASLQGEAQRKGASGRSRFTAASLQGGGDGDGEGNEGMTREQAERVAGKALQLCCAVLCFLSTLVPASFSFLCE